MSSAAEDDNEMHTLVGDYVLGLMSGEERESFEARLASNARARAAVVELRERLLDLDISAAPATPSPGLWRAIESGIERGGSVHAISAQFGRRAATGRRPSRRTFWQGFAAASVLATVGGVGLYGLTRQTPRLIVVLLDAQAQPVSIVEAFDGQRIRVVPLTGIAIPEGKTLQVWTLPSRERGPVSLGLLPGASAATLVGPELPEPKPEQLYEITIEPAGGSPTGKPTGPIVGKGFAKLPQV